MGPIGPRSVEKDERSTNPTFVLVDFFLRGHGGWLDRSRRSFSDQGPS